MQYVDPLGKRGKFFVVNQIIEDEGEMEVLRKIGRACNCRHTWIAYGSADAGIRLRDGFQVAEPATEQEPYPEDVSLYNLSLLGRASSGTLRWGRNAKIPCVCASDEMIVSCIKAAPMPHADQYSVGFNDCQTDTQHTVEGCCLTGYTASGWDPDEFYYWSKREQEEWLELLIDFKDGCYP